MLAPYVSTGEGGSPERGGFPLFLFIMRKAAKFILCKIIKITIKPLTNLYRSCIIFVD